MHFAYCLSTINYFTNKMSMNNVGSMAPPHYFPTFLSTLSVLLYIMTDTIPVTKPLALLLLTYSSAL